MLAFSALSVQMQQICQMLHCTSSEQPHCQFVMPVRPFATGSANKSVLQPTQSARF